MKRLDSGPDRNRNRPGHELERGHVGDDTPSSLYGAADKACAYADRLQQ